MLNISDEIQDTVVLKQLIPNQKPFATTSFLSLEMHRVILMHPTSSSMTHNPTITQQIPRRLEALMVFMI